MATESLTAAEAEQHRTRLIDHFKRAYQIVVGLAVTLACGRAFAGGTFDFSDPALVMFGTFFVTVVPIFHGGDRSLDLKYLGVNVTRVRDRIGYIWDVYMLLITAILFVKIAQAIPGPSLVLGAPPGDPALFYHWMANMFFFDTAVLVVDAIKSNGLRRAGQLKVYRYWIPLNLVMALVCLYVPMAHLTPQTTGLIVFAAACVRSLVDYIFGWRFMFP